MTIDDLAEVYHLGEQLFTLQKFPNLYRVWDEFEVIDTYSGNPYHCFVAVDADDRVVGFFLASIIEKRHPPRYGYLKWLGVDKAFEGKGIARKLFDTFYSLMKDEDVATLLIDTEANNKRALRFFKEKGFTSPRDHFFLTLKLK
jgi:ribosomal protein S18 acetylase RimI-like enzyme